MSSDQLLTISSFGRAVGLPTSALRHYAGAGVLVPAEVDPASGYRFYAPAQLREGVLVARLRGAGVPLKVVRQTLDAPPETGAVLLRQFASEFAGQSEARLRILVEVVADLQAAANDTHSGTVQVPGPVLARALEQVLLTAETAAAEVAGVVWELGRTGLAVAATDRYWLAHHTLPVPSVGAPVSAFTAADDTGAAARALARQPLVSASVSAAKVVIRTLDAVVLAELQGGERAVPDLGLLVACQPQRQVLAGFTRRSLLQLLVALDTDGPTDLQIAGSHASIGSAGSLLAGWATTNRPLNELHDQVGPGSHVLVRPSLLAVAVRASVGDGVLIGVAGAGDPLTVTSPDQPQMTSLVMPMQA